ncbi:MAG: HsdM family class I SAM-dependent methyltransferase [Desulfobulbaceae bacterium]
MGAVASLLVKAHVHVQEGIRFYSSRGEIIADPDLSAYVHLLTRAWEEFDLDGVVCITGIPTLYLCCFEHPLTPEKAADYQRNFWNQGVATILVLADPQTVRLYSGLAAPAEPGKEKDHNKSLIETVKLTDYAIRIHDLYLQLATGQYYRTYSGKFDAKQSVDTYLLDNLGAIRDAITSDDDGLDKAEAHTFLARILFLCYLIDRGIIDLARYPYCSCSPGAKLVDVLEQLPVGSAKKLLYRLFDDLKEKFNGSMFERSTEAEKVRLRNHHIEVLIKFLRGHPVRSRQLSLGFWAYDFRWIPVETISAIYEDFLAKEDREGKQQAGAFYTPRFLAESVLDVAIQGDRDWETKRYLDPACGSGIFLVALFNRLATRWIIGHPDCVYQEKAEALLTIMRGQLRGFDISPTACRIACFSLYLAFLDRFDPPDISEYVERTGNKLPRILLTDEAGSIEPDFPVIVREDFLSPSRPFADRFEYIVGNPPWQGRGSKQIAQDFVQKIPDHLEPQGRACILLPSKVLFNKTANPFQLQWLQSVTLEKIVQLADYSFILFKNAMCPSIIARFTAAPPDLASHVVEYETPKVRRIDLREGIIPIVPHDRKRIPLRELVYSAREKKAPIIWKQHLWGTPRDYAFLQHLLEMPRLEDSVDVLSELRKTKSLPSKRWVIGQGFKPYKQGKIPGDRSLVSIDWRKDELFVSPADIKEKLFPQPDECELLTSHLEKGDYYPDKLYSKPPEELFSPPFVLVNQGFTECAFFDYPVRFQHSLQSIAGPWEDEELLLFLTFYLRSKLARYFLFHTAANWGTERDKVHLDELLRLPFPLPGSDDASPQAEEIARTIARKARELKKQIKQELDSRSSDDFPLSGHTKRNLAAWRQKVVDGLQIEIEPLVYKYFDLIDQEIILVEDTVEVFIKSATPTRMDSSIPAQRPIHDNALPVYRDGLRPYAATLSDTLNEWAAKAQGTVRVSPIGSIDKDAGLAVVSLRQTNEAHPFTNEELPGGLAEALARLQNTVTQPAGRLDYLRGVIWFDDSSIRIIKPNTVEYWTRTAALNDAAEIYARIAQARQAARES